MLFEELMALSPRPGATLGNEISAKNLHLYLQGWFAHRARVPDCDTWADLFLANFHAFMENKYSERRTIGWQGIIAEQESDGLKQIDLFLKDLLEFCIEHPVE